MRNNNKNLVISQISIVFFLFFVFFFFRHNDCHKGIIFQGFQASSQKYIVFQWFQVF